MSLTQEQVQIIRSTVPVLETHGNAITTTFYNKLLSDLPELNNIFNRANQENEHQAKALASALYAYAANIDNLKVLKPFVEKVCQKHASLHVQPQQYEVVGQYLLQAMATVLGSALTQDILDAWTAAYWQLANLMIEREQELLSEAGEWKDWKPFKIVNKHKESDEITSFYLTPLDSEELPAFLPGQYLSIRTSGQQLNYLQPRQYSLSDAPNPHWYRISVKKEPGASPSSTRSDTHPGCVSNIMHDEKKVGDIIEVSHPAGEFFLDLQQDTDAPIVLLSAGVGLTPMVSILNTLVSHGANRPISFIHGARSHSVRAFSPHVRDMAAQYPNIRVSSFVKNLETHDKKPNEHQGRVALTKLDSGGDLFLDDNRAQYFICGPESFMVDMKNVLLERGVTEGKIKMEVFGTGEVPGSM